MAEENNTTPSSTDDTVLQQQFMRAVSSFEGIMLSQINIKNKLANRLNYGIGTGLVILGLIAASILILLLTLSSQINRISDVVTEMNRDFSVVSARMAHINSAVASMEQRVALLQGMDQHTEVMNQEMTGIATDLETMRTSVEQISGHLNTVRGNVDNISTIMNHMDNEVSGMGLEMHRMGQPARSFNKMIPFP
ncbi:translation initiation factor 2 [Sedimenticola selenatireducens]|uniref:Translation initiation factor 2 n=1 Tax=Sedimenticola selenatireducens TaxID=191960 RepID=A0A557SKA2_9GAMM|nr:translation initiation factor 2 [Sedimenticola selenatireducens]TVO77856.1 translation initiation factor 2 [Sedimenticola selenatireducens]TVT65161.1 MAG: translation initiation factor 2 [Sedimenticola selenatireducens]